MYLFCPKENAPIILSLQFYIEAKLTPCSACTLRMVQERKYKEYESKANTVPLSFLTLSLLVWSIFQFSTWSRYNASQAVKENEKYYQIRAAPLIQNSQLKLRMKLWRYVSGMCSQILALKGLKLFRISKGQLEHRKVI